MFAGCFKALLSKGSWIAEGKTEGIDTDKHSFKKLVCVGQSPPSHSASFV